VVGGATDDRRQTTDSSLSGALQGLSDRVNGMVVANGDVVTITPMSINAKKLDENANFNSMIEAQHATLLENKNAIRYLVQRGISMESIKRFKLGFSFRLKHDWISIPSFSDGICKLIKYRQIPPENPRIDKYIREAGGKSILFNEECLDKFEEIIIAEGELSALSAIQNGFENTVGLTVGCGTLDPDWYEKLYLKEKLYIILDNDSAGQNSARNVFAKRLGIDKCYNIVLPEAKDIDEYFQSHTKEEFGILLKTAKRFKVDGLISLQDAILNMYIQGEAGIPRLSLPWGIVNKMLGGGLRRKEVLVVGGQAAVGKTSFCIQMGHHFAKLHKIPSLFFCLEMDEVALAIKVIQNDLDLAYSEISYNDSFLYLERLSDLRMFLGYKRHITTEVFYNTVKEARNRYGCELIFFDNIQLLVPEGDEGKIAVAMADFKALAMDLDVMMVIVSQPRKLNDESKMPNFNDLKNSSAIAQTADSVLILHRQRVSSPTGDTSFLGETSVIGDKARFASGGKGRLKFIGEKSRFEDSYT
jgi:KaiC/GvpD/RAD55 family RecA-like ATPase